MHRRALIVAALALVATPVAAAPAKPAGPKTIEVGKAFPFLDRYLKLPAGERDRFVLAYVLTRDGRPFSGTVATLVDGAARIPITASPTGRLERLPTLEQLAAKRALVFEGSPPTAKFGVSLSLEPTLKPAKELPAPELAAAVAQAASGAKKAAGLMRLAIPKLDAVRLVGATGAEAIGADGRAAPLPIEKGAPVFRPAQHPGARLVRSATAPRQLQIQ